MMKRTYAIGASTLTLEFGDLTKSSADVLVSSDDSYISMGGGVSAAILRAGGASILVDAAKKVPARLGDVVVTAAGHLPAKHVFHAITIGDGKLPFKDIVSATTKRCFELLDILGLNSIAFPAIGTGVAGFPYREVAGQMAEAIVDALARRSRPADATLYLYDRFGQMEPMDFITFFEEFAVRTSHLPITLQAPAGPPPSRPASRRRSRQERRKALLEELGLLDGERQALEVKLATRDGALSKDEKRTIDRRLNEIRGKRIEVLSAVKIPTKGPVPVFVSYSHDDERSRKKLGKHLSPLVRQGLISIWHDRMIRAGTNWEDAIDERLETARVVLLLVSDGFVSSGYCYGREMKRAMERRKRGEAEVIPVLLKPVSLHGLPLETLQALPRDGKPTTLWKNRDSAFVDITEGLRAVVEGLDNTEPAA
jgi:O-acetyl-ADP-ribose deacetylase (regulator of RNase III)